MLLHIGGQFNEEPGTFSEYMVKHFSDIGVDVIVGHHPHTVQKISKIGDTVVAYSLGGFCLSPSSDYVIPSCLPDYSVLFHVDIDEKTMHFETSTEIIRCIEAKNHGLHIVKAATDSAQTKTILKRLNY